MAAEQELAVACAYETQSRTCLTAAEPTEPTEATEATAHGRQYAGASTRDLREKCACSECAYCWASSTMARIPEAYSGRPEGERTAADLLPFWARCGLRVDDEGRSGCSWCL